MENTENIEGSQEQNDAPTTPTVDQFRGLANEFSLIRLRGKVPVEAGWQRFCATRRTFEEIGFEAGDNAGIACGSASGVLVVDVDDLRKFRNFLKEKDYKLPRTRIHRTGSGKFHVLYEYPDNGKRYANRSKKELGIDIRGHGGQIVAPGSVHPETGKLYRVERDVPIAPAPQWLLDLAADGEKPGGDGSESPPEIDFRWADRIQALQVDRETRQAILEGVAVGKRSEAQAKVIWKLLDHDPPLSDAQIHGIFVRHPIGNKMREKGSSTQQSHWLQADIDRIKRDISEKKKDKPSPGKHYVAETLVNLARDFMFFHTSDAEPYATVSRNGHQEHWNLNSSGSKDLLIHIYFSLFGKPPGVRAVQDALSVLRAKALYEGEAEEVHLRVGEKDGNVYIDLANKRWEAVKIAPDGWKVVSNPPVKFVRTNSTRPLPHPERGGSLEELRPYITGGMNWIVCCAWLLQALNPHSPYPILIIEGEHGSAKTTVTKLLKFLIDPGYAPVRTYPRKEQDLLIAAKNSFVLPYDNLSGLSPWGADAVCRLSTGGGYGTRAHYTNSEESIIKATRPIILNGIDQISHRADLVDRAILLNLPSIPESQRRPERELLQHFEAIRPRILGALCDALTAALLNLPTTVLENLPRMADFALFICAAESALPWCPGEFLEAYRENRQEAIESSLEADPVASATREFMCGTSEWVGTSTALLDELNRIVPEHSRGRWWPKTAESLSKRLKRASPFLRTVGIHIDDIQRQATRRLKRITNTASSDCEGGSGNLMREDSPDGNRSSEDGGTDELF